MITIQQLNRSHNNAMLRMLESSPMETNTLDLHFDKSPDIFLTTSLWSNHFKYYGVFIDEQLAGFGMYLIYKGYIGNELYDIVYAGNFCIDTKQRKKGLLIKLSEFMLGNLPREYKYGFCIILQGNTLAERYFNKYSIVLPSLPSNRIVLAYETKSILILQRKTLNSKYIIRTAELEDIALIKALIQKEQKPQFLSRANNDESFERTLVERPHLTIEDYYLAFENSTLVGFCAAWDMSKIKRTRILKYKKAFKVVRLFHNLVSKLLKYPDLPKKGEAIKEVYIIDTVIKDQNHEVLEALLKSIYATYRKKKYNLINFGSYKNDPLLKAAKSFYSTPLYSNIYFSALNDNKLKANKIDFSKPFIEIALI